MKLRRIIAGISAVVMSVSALSFSTAWTVSAEPADDVFDNLNQQQITEEMGPGWNLGNQLEAVDGSCTPNETAWGNPVITQETFKMVKDAGFKNVRIPVSYFTKIGAAPDYTIDAAWLGRVKEVVDMALAEGLYAIINMHGDGYNSMAEGWLLCNAPDEEQPAIREKYGACWKQIANVFKDYDEHLIFEAMNEEFDGENYGSGLDRKHYENINAYSQIFVDTVRQTGGNNTKRWLMVCGWNTNIELTVGDYGFALPTDTYRDPSIPEGEQRIMVSVHYYDPWDFCGDGKSSTSTWGTETEIKYLQDSFTRCYASFVMKGYPVVIGEYGCVNKYNEAYRVKFVTEVCKNARSRGIIPVIWDNNGHGVGDDKFGLFDRSTFAVTQKNIVNAIVGAYEGEAEPAPEIIDPITQDEALSILYWDLETTVVSGVADKDMNGAKRIRYIFDCASDVAFNSYTTINLSATVAGKKSSGNVTGDSGMTGATACTMILDLQNPIKTGDIYSFSMYTQSWLEAKDYVFLIRCVEFLDANGNVIKTIDKSNIPDAPPATKPTTNKPDPTPPTNVTKPAKVTKVKVVAKKKKLKVSWQKVSDACGYEIMYATNRKFTKGKKIVDVKKAKATLKNLKAKKKYFVKVRAYKKVTTSGTKCVSKKYGKWSKVVKKKTK